MVMSIREVEHGIRDMKEKMMMETTGFVMISKELRAIVKGKSYTLRFGVINRKGEKKTLKEPVECTLCLEEYSTQAKGRTPLFKKCWTAVTDCKHEVEFHNVFMPLSIHRAVKTKVALTISGPGIVPLIIEDLAIKERPGLSIRGLVR